MSDRKWLYDGLPTGTPSTKTVIVEPSSGMNFGSCVSAHPKFT